MSDRSGSTLFSGSRALFWLMASVALPAAVLLPFAWHAWSLPGTLLLCALEAALVLLLLAMRDPLRFHWAERGLFGLVACAALVLTAAVLTGPPGTLASWSRAEALLVLAFFGLPSLVVAVRGRLELGRARDELEERREQFGELTTEGRRIRYTLADDSWELDQDEILVVGELTTESLGDDYGLCFLKELNGDWLRASFYAAGHAEALRRLGEELGAPLQHGLCNRTSFASRVMWPPELVGQPLFVEEDTPARGVWETLLDRIGLRGRSLHVSPALLEALRARARRK